MTAMAFGCSLYGFKAVAAAELHHDILTEDVKGADWKCPSALKRVQIDLLH